MKILNSSEMKEVDKITMEKIGIPGLILMENAGMKVIKAMEMEFDNLIPYKIAVVSGKGNNGGDGFVIARQLFLKGIDVDIYLLSKKDEIKGDAKTNLNILYNYKDTNIVEIPDEKTFNKMKVDFNNYQIIVDAILGTGLKKEAKGYYGFIIRKINDSSSFVVSVDIPSGLFSDRYRPVENAIYSNLTVTFTAPKRGIIASEAEDYIGKLYVASIGTPDFLIDDKKYKFNLITSEELQMLFFPRNRRSFKSHFGKINIISGTTNNKNAPILSGLSALRCGCGSVVIYSSVESTPQHPELILKKFEGTMDFKAIIKELERGDITLFGKGIEKNEVNRKFIEDYLKNSETPAIFNSDGTKLLDFNLIENRKCERIVILTSPNELSKLINIPTFEIEENREEIGLEFAKKYGITIVLKGHREVITFPDGEVFINTRGNPGMATEGSGDVLAGMISGLCGRISQQSEYAWKLGVCCGVFLNGLSGDIAADKKGEEGMISSDIVDSIPEAIKRIKYEDLEKNLYI